MLKTLIKLMKFQVWILVSIIIPINCISSVEASEVGESKIQISKPVYIASGIITTTTIGAGLGHAIQGRWRQKGWIFTAACFGLPLATMLAVGHPAGALFGFGLYVPFHIWEIVDIWGSSDVEVLSMEVKPIDIDNQFSHKVSQVEIVMPVLGFRF
jgi:hypothetical protein